MSDPSGYFSDRADDYARWRPGYPQAAVDAALAGFAPPVRVVDVGCGTGIASRAFAAAGCEVSGVEPDAIMRSTAMSHATPESLRYVDGRAEATGLDDACADVVVVAQAFHWFDFDPALLEFWRLLRTGGRLALMWNVRSVEDPFMSSYAEVVSAAQDHTERQGKRVSRSRVASPDESPWFSDAQRLTFPNTSHLPWEGIVGRLSSASYFPREGSVRESLLGRLRVAFELHARDGQVDYVQTTALTLATRAEPGP
jgi:SAM-dependent methyltransferase